MGKYRKYKNSIERFLASDRGRRFFNFAYSWGASIVILGAMFKLLHFPFGNEMLFLGMVTECTVFFLSAFDRPIKDYNWEEVFPVLATNDPEDRPNLNMNAAPQGNGGQTVSQGESQVSSAESQTHAQPQQAYVATPQNQSAQQQPGTPVQQLGSVAENVDKFAQATDTLTKISESLMESYKHIIDNSHNISQNSLGYVQQMEALNKNIAGLNTIYELQLRTISGQMESIEHINSGLNRIRTMYDGSITDSTVFKHETEKMTQQLQALNQVYARLLKAMTVNMPGATQNPGFNNPPTQI